MSGATPSPAGGAVERGAGDVAGGDDQREAERGRAVLVRERLAQREGTVTRSPGRMLPTLMVKTSGRSSSAIAARLPWAIARS